jgi:hypothetical protein
MKALILAALYQSETRTAPQSADSAAQSEADLFRARDRALRRLRPGRIRMVLAALVPAALTARLAARRARRDLEAQITRLEALSPHLLDDIGVEELGPHDYVVRITDLDARPRVSASPDQVAAQAPDLATRPAVPRPTAPILVPAAGRRAARGTVATA